MHPVKLLLGFLALAFAPLLSHADMGCTSLLLAFFAGAPADPFAFFTQHISSSFSLFKVRSGRMGRRTRLYGRKASWTGWPCLTSRSPV